MVVVYLWYHMAFVPMNGHGQQFPSSVFMNY